MKMKWNIYLSDCQWNLLQEESLAPLNTVANELLASLGGSYGCMNQGRLQMQRPLHIHLGWPKGGGQVSQRSAGTFVFHLSVSEKYNNPFFILIVWNYKYIHLQCIILK